MSRPLRSTMRPTTQPPAMVDSTKQATAISPATPVPKSDAPITPAIENIPVQQPALELKQVDMCNEVKGED